MAEHNGITVELHCNHGSHPFFCGQCEEEGMEALRQHFYELGKKLSEELNKRFIAHLEGDVNETHQTDMETGADYRSG